MAAAHFPKEPRKLLKVEVWFSKQQLWQEKNTFGNVQQYIICVKTDKWKTYVFRESSMFFFKRPFHLKMCGASSFWKHWFIPLLKLAGDYSELDSIQSSFILVRIHWNLFYPWVHTPGLPGRNRVSYCYLSKWRSILFRRFEFWLFYILDFPESVIQSDRSNPGNANELAWLTC